MAAIGVEPWIFRALDVGILVISVSVLHHFLIFCFQTCLNSPSCLFFWGFLVKKFYTLPTFFTCSLNAECPVFSFLFNYHKNKKIWMQLYHTNWASCNIIVPLSCTSVPISLLPSGFPTKVLYGCAFRLCVLRILPIFFCPNIITLN